MAKVRVPATSANMGPGFDCMGMALNLYNYVEIEEAQDTTVVIQNNIQVQNKASIEKNLILLAARRVYEACGRTPTPLLIRERNSIPTSRGLGSSAACVIGGMVAANTLLGNPLSKGRLLALATQMEGHPDNAVPCLLGGVSISYWNGERVTWVRGRLPGMLRVIALIPPYTTKTAGSRTKLPETVPFGDAVYNTAHAAMLSASLLTGNLIGLKEALHDRLHQPYRLPDYPIPPTFFDDIVAMGALGMYLSGSGSAFCVLAEARTRGLEADILAYLQKNEIDMQLRTLYPDTQGAVILS